MPQSLLLFSEGNNLLCWKFSLDWNYFSPISLRQKGNETHFFIRTFVPTPIVVYYDKNPHNIVFTYFTLNGSR